MTEIAFRAATESDFTGEVTINAGEVRHTSPMDEARLRYLSTLAEYHEVATVDGEVAAFLIAMRDGCGYVNENYQWFEERYPNFLYVDRIVVGAAHQRLGLGTGL